MTIIREEREQDWLAVADVVARAFEGSEEALLVDRLRANREIALALVAETGAGIVGQISFSPMRAPFAALGLAPLSVLPAFQKKGIGSSLVREGLRLARREGWKAVFVVGDPAFYGRFGFSVEAAAGFSSPYAGPYFMLLALRPLPIRVGPVDYAPAFSALG